MPKEIDTTYESHWWHDRAHSVLQINYISHQFSMRLLTLASLTGEASHGFPVPNMLAFLSTKLTLLTGSLTVRGSNCNFGRTVVHLGEVSEELESDSCCLLPWLRHDRPPKTLASLQPCRQWLLDPKSAETRSRSRWTPLTFPIIKSKRGSFMQTAVASPVK